MTRQRESHFSCEMPQTRIVQLLSHSPLTSPKELQAVMGNKDKRKEKKKPKQPKEAPKPSVPSRFGSAKPSK